MRTLRAVLPILGLAAAAALNAAVNPAARTVVVFDHPERFTDIKDAYTPTEKGQQANLDMLRDYLVYVTGNQVPEGDRLTVTFTDIDLAGEYEPWHGPMAQDVRFLRDVYPPAFKFTWTLTDASGKVLRSGKEDIRDVAYQMRAVLDRADPLCYEKAILADWARAALRGLKKG